MNTLDPEYFPENIRDGYRQRKERHEDRGNEKLEINAELFQLIQGSNQIIHNRGRALAYLGNADKKRKLAGGNGGGDIPSSLGGAPRMKHSYKPARELKTNNDMLPQQRMAV